MSEFRPTDEQKALIRTEDSGLIIAGPGTGKTRTAVEKAMVEVRSFDENSLHRILIGGSKASWWRRWRWR